MLDNAHFAVNDLLCLLSVAVVGCLVYLMRNKICFYKLAAIISIILLASPILSFAQGADSPSTSPIQLANLDIYAKIFLAVITGLGTILGLPLVLMNFKKAQVEIRKLKLEATALETKMAEVKDEAVKVISIHDSNHVSVQIMADPRFLGPLLLLLDFIYAWIVMMLAGYCVRILDFGLISPMIQVLLAIIVLYPIAKEARHLKSELHPQKSQSDRKPKKEITSDEHK
jgi:hypothetical protein